MDVLKLAKQLLKSIQENPEAGKEFEKNLKSIGEPIAKTVEDLNIFKKSMLDEDYSKHFDNFAKKKVEKKPDGILPSGDELDKKQGVSKGVNPGKTKKAEGIPAPASPPISKPKGLPKPKPQPPVMQMGKEEIGKARIPEQKGVHSAFEVQSHFPRKRAGFQDVKGISGMGHWSRQAQRLKDTYLQDPSKRQGLISDTQAAARHSAKHHLAEQKSMPKPNLPKSEIFDKAMLKEEHSFDKKKV